MKKIQLLFLVFFLTSTSHSQWVQKGSDVDGEAPNDQSGVAVVISCSVRSDLRIEKCDYWSIPDTLTVVIDTSVIRRSHRRLICQDSQFNLAYNIPLEDTMYVNRVVCHRANSRAFVDSRTLSGQGTTTIRILVCYNVEGPTRQPLVVHIQVNGLSKVCRINTVPG
ncbi:MAG: hypothetical protein ACI9J3_000951 [Parvicellaceae bacterium]|jgi:hypothetical protein